MIEISVQKSIKDAKREFSDLTAHNIKRGVSNAINHTLGVSKTMVRRSIQGQYKIRAKELNKAMRIQRASARQPVQYGMLIAKGSPLPLIGFGARQVKRGVSVNVLSGRTVIKKAFIGSMRTGYRGVFARGTYSGSEFQFRTKRIRKSGSDLPITELKTVSIPKALGNSVVIKHLTEKINTHFPGRLTHELMRLRTSVGDGV